MPMFATVHGFSADMWSSYTASPFKLARGRLQVSFSFIS
jgi:hypothetical protein